MISLSTHRGRVEYDPAMLAFVKCHLTSFIRWDVLRLLAEQPRRWIDATDAARTLHKPLPTVQSALDALEREDLVAVRRSPHGDASYRMDPLEPSTRVVERLVAAATHSQELRQIIIARVLEATRLAS